MRLTFSVAVTSQSRRPLRCWDESHREFSSEPRQRYRGPRRRDQPEQQDTSKQIFLDTTPEGPDGRPKFLSQDDEYFALDELWDDKKYWWNEEDYDVWFKPEDDFSELFDKDGKFTVKYTEADLMEQPPDWLVSREDETPIFSPAAYGEPAGDESGGNGVDSTNDNAEETNHEQTGDFMGQAKYTEKKLMEKMAQSNQKEEAMDPEKRFFDAENDIFEVIKKDDSWFKTESLQDKEFREMVLPLAPTLGRGGVEDFVSAMHEHPTDYASVTWKFEHPNSKREPIPMFKEHRKELMQPPKEFLDSHKRFLYVTGLPPLTIDGKLGDVGNPVDRSVLEQTVASLVGVDSTQVFVANRTSAFVGYHAPRHLANILKDGPKEKVLTLVPHLQKYDPDFFVEMKAPLQEFVDQGSSPDCMIHLTNLPLGITSSSLAKSIIPKDSELEQVYGTLKAEDVHILSRNSALVRFSSAEKVKSILESSLFQDRMKAIGTYQVKFLRARRALKHWGFERKDTKEQIRVNANKLMVDGIHMPSKQFYISHASALQVRGLDPDVMYQKYLTEFFQKYSPKRRRALSSIEFVKCELTGEPILGMAYIGFEEPEEAEACLNSCQDGKMMIGDELSQLFLCQDRVIPNYDTAPETRSVRPVEELEDEMVNWQKYTTEEDIEYLDKNGVPRVVLDEMMRGIRRNNRFYGVFDGNFRKEKITPEKAPKQNYRDLVQEAIKTMKSCVATRENPGEAFYSQYKEGEEFDYSAFDDWEKKKAELNASRAKYYE